MKISFVGAGRIGCTTAYSVINALDIDEIVLLDIKPELAKGQALDLAHCARVLGKKIEVKATKDYEDVQNSEVTIISAGKARQANMQRRQLLTQNVQITKQIIKKVTQHNNGIILQVANPVDILTYVAYQESGFPRNKVFGMSGVLDTARLQSLGFEGMILGHHGEKMVPTTKLKEKDLEKVRYASLPVISLKGSTYYAPASAITKMIRAIIKDTKEVMPASCILNGEYGLKGLAMGVPAMIGKNGVEKIIELDLDEEQKQMLSESASFIKNILSTL